MTFLTATPLWKHWRDWKKQPEFNALLILTAVFFSFMLIFSLNRYFCFYASYDHGLFNQLFWNNLRGNFFQSSLTGANSVGVIQDGKIPTVNFIHLGQHFVVAFLLWLPIYALFPSPITLVVLQVVLMTLGGIVLYALARHYLKPRLALMILASYYTAGAVIGPTFANFYEHCQIPLLVFGMLLALEKRTWWAFWLLFLLSLGIREDTGLILFSIGLYLILSRRYPRIGAVLCIVSFAYVVLVTNVIMPHFSSDNSRLYLASRFSSLVGNNPNPSTLQIFWGMLTHPDKVLLSLFTPVDERLAYLGKMWLPLAFIPVLSPATWALTAVPLLSLLVQDSSAALVISLRYAIAVVPGMFYGAVLWWSSHTDWFKQRLRLFWIACMTLSVVIAIASNPNQAFSFLIPDSPSRGVYVPLNRQWEHANHIRNVIREIPPNVSAAASTYIIPQLSSRRELIRVPQNRFINEQGQVIPVDYMVADIWRLKIYQAAFRNELRMLLITVPAIDQNIAEGKYGVVKMEDGVILLQRGVPSNPQALSSWLAFRQELLPILEGKTPFPHR
jgi:uncharacterized membrane protein